MVRCVTKRVLALRNQYIKWPNGKMASSLIYVIKKNVSLVQNDSYLFSERDPINIFFSSHNRYPVERNNGKFQSRRGIPRRSGSNKMEDL